MTTNDIVCNNCHGYMDFTTAFYVRGRGIDSRLRTRLSQFTLFVVFLSSSRNIIIWSFKIHHYCCLRFISISSFHSFIIHISCCSLWSTGHLWNVLVSLSVSYRQSGGLLGRGISSSLGRYLHAEQHKHGINAHRHPCFKWDSNPEPTIPVFEREKTVHALYRASIVIDYFFI
jgi:hypothetical protein